MRNPILVALLAASSAWAAPAQPDKKPGTPDGNTKPDLVGVCKADVKTPRRMIEHGFHWMKDPAVAMKLSEKFASYLACAAKVEGKDPCKAVDAMAPVYKFDKEMGTMLQQCKDMDQYVDFYHEMMTAPRKSRKFPACTEYLGTLGSPMIKIFDTTAIAPPSADPEDPTSDGKFWYVCQYLANGIRDNKTNFCTDPRVHYWLNPKLSPQFWQTMCGSASKLWVRGDETFCNLTHPAGGGVSKCPMWADYTKAFRRKDIDACPDRNPARGLCIAGASPNPKEACGALWDQVQNEFCTERAKVRLEDLPPKPKDGKTGAQPDAKAK